ncbi:hypothetical protein K4F52_007536 [Lecanicillium sp. MT-2017a]|nr:hypothetical protein K4F52_007536 [Lecanicillium sp. MT-2017a]
MPGAGPGTSSRGRGGKWKKYSRGGGRHFSRDLQPADEEGNKVSMWSANARHRGGDDDDDDEDDSEEDSSEEDSDDEPAKGGASAADQSREDRKAQKKARKEAAIARQKSQNVQVGDMPSSDEDDEEDSDADMPANPNHSRAARNQTARPKAVEEITQGVSKMAVPGNRKEREALEAQASKERYMKLQAEGKTDQAKADLARLKLIREQRAAEAARREAEREEKEAQDAARKSEIEAREKKLREAAAAPKKSKKK